MKKRKVIGEYSVWRDAYVLLDWVFSADLHYTGMDVHGEQDVEWFLWWIDEGGAEQVIRLTPIEVSALRRDRWSPSPSLVVAGTLHGLGVWTPQGGPLRISTYVPPHWPTVQTAEGEERTVTVALMTDEQVGHMMNRPNLRLSAIPADRSDAV